MSFSWIVFCLMHMSLSLSFSLSIFASAIARTCCAPLYFRFIRGVIHAALLTRPSAHERSRKQACARVHARAHTLCVFMSWVYCRCCSEGTQAPVVEVACAPLEYHQCMIINLLSLLLLCSYILCLIMLGDVMFLSLVCILFWTGTLIAPLHFVSSEG